MTLGAHSRSHPHLTRVPASALEDEIEGSAQDLRREVGVSPLAFAYPYGAISSQAASLVKRTFAVGVTTELRMMHLRDQAHLLPRLDMFYYREPGRLERWGTSAFRRHWFREKAPPGP